MDRSGVGRIVEMPNAAQDLAQLRERHVQPGTPCAMALQYRSMRWPNLARTWPELGPELTGLSRQLAGGGSDAGVSEAAERTAEAQLDLARIRHARHRLILAVEAKLMPGQEPATLAGRRAAWEEAMEQTIRELSPSLAKVYARK